MKIYFIHILCDQEGPKKTIVVSFNLTRKEETQIHRCVQPKIPNAVEARGQNLFGLTYENMNQLTLLR